MSKPAPVSVSWVNIAFAACYLTVLTHNVTITGKKARRQTSKNNCLASPNRFPAKKLNVAVARVVAIVYKVASLPPSVRCK